MSHRLCFSGGSWHRPQNSHAALLDKYWTKLQMGNMTREELKKVRRASASSLDLLLFICHLLLNCFQNPLESTWLFCVKVLVSRYPGLSVVSDRLLDIYCQLTGDKHSDPNTNDLLSPDDDPPAEDRVSPLEGRALSLRSDSALPDG